MRLVNIKWSLNIYYLVSNALNPSPKITNKSLQQFDVSVNIQGHFHDLPPEILLVWFTSAHISTFIEFDKTDR